MSGKVRLRAFLAAWTRQTAGAAAVELALVLMLLLLPVLNLVDFAVYAFSRMQVEEAAQMGAQGAWTACNNNQPGLQPAIGGACSAFSAAVTNGVHSTYLGSNVSVVSGSPVEGYYCTTTAGGLTALATWTASPAATKPANCTGAAGASDPNAAPGDYVQVAVTFTYAPLFHGVSIVSLLNTTVTKTAWTRIA